MHLGSSATGTTLVECIYSEVLYEQQVDLPNTEQCMGLTQNTHCHLSSSALLLVLANTRLNYIHWVEDLLRERLPTVFPAPSPGKRELGVDVGTGVSCIYPLLGARVYNWHFIGTDIDAEAIACASKLASVNGLAEQVSLVQVPVGAFLTPAVTMAEAGARRGIKPTADPIVDFTMCNPPFFSDIAAANSNPRCAGGGAPCELVTEGACALCRQCARLFVCTQPTPLTLTLSLPFISHSSPIHLPAPALYNVTCAPDCEQVVRSSLYEV